LEQDLGVKLFDFSYTRIFSAATLLQLKSGAKFMKKNDFRGVGSHQSNENQVNQIEIK
jgi:hypothetical protein